MPAALPVCGDLNASGSIGASDSLLLLRRAVGQGVSLSCPACTATDCGNGVRDGSEACEGLDGCDSNETCTASCTCQATELPPATSQELIAEALAGGDIDYPTSILYRVWALFGAPELPEAYDGAGSAGEDTDLLIELSHVRGTLPDEIEEAITPYLVRPNDPLSVYTAEPSAALLTTTAAGEAPPPVNCPAVNNVSGWGSFGTAHFVVWSCETGRCESGKPMTTACTDHSDCNSAEGELDGFCTLPTPIARRLVVGAVAEQVYAAFHPELGAPRPDDYPSGPEPRDRIDIYMLRPNECRTRHGSCVPIGGSSIAAAMPDTPCGRQGSGPLTSSGYAVVNADGVPALAPGPGEASSFRSDLDHELFHVWEFGLNAEVMDYVCIPDGLGQGDGKTWLTEASAEWASFGYFPQDDQARRTTLFQSFQSERDPSTEGLHALGESIPAHAILPYEAGLYLQFLQQEAGSRQPVVDLWTTSQAARSNVAFDKHLDSIAPFAKAFREFAVRDLNNQLPDDPITLFSDFDEARPANVLPRLLLPSPQLSATSQFDRPIVVAPLFSRFELFQVDESARYVRIDVSDVPNSEHLQLDAIVHTDAGWERRKVAGPIFEFCREDPGDDISNFYLVLSNHDRMRAGRIDGEYSVETSTLCPGGWSGQIRMVWTFDESSHESGPSESSTYERHDREEQSWTVRATNLVTPQPQQPPIEELTTAFQVTSVVDIRQTGTSACSSPPPTTGTDTDTQSGNAGFRATSFFDTFPLGNGTYSLTPIAPSHSFELPVTMTDDDQCDGTSLTIETSQAVNEGFTWLTISPGLTYLVPAPNDPGHFVGSESVLHFEEPRPGGDSVLDVTVSWDLRRTAER